MDERVIEILPDLIIEDKQYNYNYDKREYQLSKRFNRDVKGVIYVKDKPLILFSDGSLYIGDLSNQLISHDVFQILPYDNNYFIVVSLRKGLIILHDSKVITNTIYRSVEYVSDRREIFNICQSNYLYFEYFVTKWKVFYINIKDMKIEQCATFIASKVINRGKDSKPILITNGLAYEYDCESNKSTEIALLPNRSEYRYYQERILPINNEHIIWGDEIFSLPKEENPNTEIFTASRRISYIQWEPTQVIVPDLYVHMFFSCRDRGKAVLEIIKTVSLFAGHSNNIKTLLLSHELKGSNTTTFFPIRVNEEKLNQIYDYYLQHIPNFINRNIQNLILHFCRS